MTLTDLEVHFLDVGEQMYGDAMLIRGGGVCVLIDGGHRGNLTSTTSTQSIPEQLRHLLTLAEDAVIEIDLLVVTHCHSDHIGCLPEMVLGGLMRPRLALVADEFLGFGRTSSAVRQDDEQQLPAVVRKVLAGLREESWAGGQRDDIQSFLNDAVTLEARYHAMLARLTDDGTAIVRFGVDDVRTLEAEFSAAIGLQIHGPTQGQLLVCAEQLQREQRRAVRALMSATSADVSPDPVELYLNALRAHSVTDASGGQGAAVNNQSIVLSVGQPGRQVLLPGDMQFADPGVAGVAELTAPLFRQVTAQGPYALVKSPHHTSLNGFSVEDFRALTQDFIVHTGGRNDPAHPAPDLLRQLAHLTPAIRFGRTDQNGLVTFRDGNLVVRRGTLDNFRPNRRGDSSMPETDEPEIHIHLHVPRNVPSIHVHVHVEDRLSIRDKPSVRVKRLPSTRTQSNTEADMPSLQIAGDRPLPPLAFVTDYNRLKKYVPENILRLIIETLDKSEAGHTLILANGQQDALAKLAEVKGVAGVVILGGYDVLPAIRLTTLTQQIEQDRDFNPADDEDFFIVWSDDAYGDMDGDGVADRPVSRIPQGEGGELLLAALNGQPIPDAEKFGIRNRERPFAEEVWNNMPGRQALLASAPTDMHSLQEPIHSKTVYLMLHGSAEDKSAFWGEGDNGTIEAFGIQNIPSQFGGVVFTGCCYGALLTSDRAVDCTDAYPDCLSTGESIALKFLSAGAQAYIGCTGTHYSPTEHVNAYGSPLHHFFMKQLNAHHQAPALALFKARQDYFNGIPFVPGDILTRAIELKTWQQFTCLGLGW